MYISIEGILNACFPFHQLFGGTNLKVCKGKKQAAHGKMEYVGNR